MPQNTQEKNPLEKLFIGPLESCISYDSNGNAVINLELAKNIIKKQFRIGANAYHPDSNDGSRIYEGIFNVIVDSGNEALKMSSGDLEKSVLAFFNNNKNDYEEVISKALEQIDYFENKTAELSLELDEAKKTIALYSSSGNMKNSDELLKKLRKTQEELNEYKNFALGNNTNSSSASNSSNSNLLSELNYAKRKIEELQSDLDGILKQFSPKENLLAQISKININSVYTKVQGLLNSNGAYDYARVFTLGHVSGKDYGDGIINLQNFAKNEKIKNPVVSKKVSPLTTFETVKYIVEDFNKETDKFGDLRSLYDRLSHFAFHWQTSDAIKYARGSTNFEITIASSSLLKKFKCDEFSSLQGDISGLETEKFKINNLYNVALNKGNFLDLEAVRFIFKEDINVIKEFQNIIYAIDRAPYNHVVAKSHFFVRDEGDKQGALSIIVAGMGHGCSLSGSEPFSREAHFIVKK